MRCQGLPDSLLGRKVCSRIPPASLGNSERGIRLVKHGCGKWPAHVHRCVRTSAAALMSVWWSYMYIYIYIYI